MNENPIGAYALYEFLKELVEQGEIKENNDNSEVYYQNDDGVIIPITDFSFDDNDELILWN